MEPLYDANGVELKVGDRVEIGYYIYLGDGNVGEDFETLTMTEGDYRNFYTEAGSLGIFSVTKIKEEK